MKNKYFFLLLNLYPPVFLLCPLSSIQLPPLLAPFIPLLPIPHHPSNPQFLLCSNFSSILSPIFLLLTHSPPSISLTTAPSLRLSTPVSPLSTPQSPSLSALQPPPIPSQPPIILHQPPKMGTPGWLGHGPPLSLLQQRSLSQQQQGSGQRK